MRKIAAKHWVTLAIALAAGLACRQLVSPQPRWAIPPVMARSPWDKVFFSRDGAWLASYQPTSADNDVRKLCLWDMADGRLLEVLHDGPGQLESLAIAPDKSQIAVWWHDRRIDVWEFADGKVAARKRHQAAEHWYPHLHVVFGDDCRLLLYGPNITSGKLWDAADGALVADLALNERDCDSWTTNFPEFIVGSSDKAIHLWSLVSPGFVVHVPEGGSVFAARNTAKGSVVGYRPRHVDLLRVHDSGAGVTHTLPLSWQSVAWGSFDVSPDGRTVALQVRDHRPISAWLLQRLTKAFDNTNAWRMDFVDIPTGAAVASLPKAERARFSPDGGAVAVSHDNGAIAVYAWPLRRPWPWILAAAAAAAAGWLLLTLLARRALRARS